MSVGMMMMLFQLFRIKVLRNAQDSFLAEKGSSEDILTLVINVKPSAELRKGQTWHIGNVDKIDENGYFFAFGKTKKSIFEKYDEEKGEFTEESFDTSPYTYVFLDTKIQVCSIAPEIKLAQKTKGIADRLKKLLNTSNIVLDNNVKIDIEELKDPKDFVSLLKDAYSIGRFYMTFHPPNPFDTDNDFYLKCEDVLKTTNGEKGVAIIKGEKLKPEPLIELTNSIASLGGDASASIKTTPESGFITKRLGEKCAFLGGESDMGTKKNRQSFLGKMREFYYQIKGQ